MGNLPVSIHDRMPESRDDIVETYLAQRIGQVHPVSENNLHDYLQIILRRKWTIILSLLLVFSLVLAGVIIEKPIYKAQTTLLIEGINPNIAPVQEGLIQNLSLPTELEIIKDISIIEKLVDKLDIARKSYQEYIKSSSMNDASIFGWIGFTVSISEGLFPNIKKIFSQKKESTPEQSKKNSIISYKAHEYKVVEDLYNSIKVVPRIGTKLIDITLTGDNAKNIAEQINTLVDIYISNNLNNKLYETRKSIRWLQVEASSLEEKVQLSQSQLKEFREKHQFVDYDSGKKPNPLIEKINILNSEYTTIRKYRAVLNDQIRMTKLLSLNKNSNMIESITNEMGSPILDRLKNDYIELKSQYISLSGVFKSQHPRISTLHTQLEELKKLVIKTLRSQHRSMQVKEREIERQLAEINNSMMSYQDDMTQYTSLLTEFDLNKSLYLDVQKRLREFSLTEALETTNIKVIRRADVPLYPLPSGKLYKLVAGLIVGLGLGVGCALTKEFFYGGFSRPDEIESYLCLPLLGTIPRHRKVKHSPGEPMVLQQPRGVESEAYGILRTRLQAVSRDAVKTLLVTSTLPGEGKSTTVANLGVSFAQLGQRVLLVDVDLRRSSLHRHFLASHDQGVNDVLTHNIDWRQLLQETCIENLTLLPVGAPPHNPAELLSSQAMQDLLTEVREAFDLVIFDAPVVLSIPDVEIMAPFMDGVLLIHDLKKGSKELVSESKKILQRTRSHILGVVLNKINSKKFGYYGQYGSYNYYGYESINGFDVSPIHSSKRTIS